MLVAHFVRGVFCIARKYKVSRFFFANVQPLGYQLPRGSFGAGGNRHILKRTLQQLPVEQSVAQGRQHHIGVAAPAFNGKQHIAVVDAAKISKQVSRCMPGR